MNVNDRYAQSFHKSAFEIHVESGPKFMFICSSPLHKTLWLYALRNAFVGAFCRENKLKDEAKHENLGWQHEKIITNIYAATYCGDVEMLRHILESPECDKQKLSLPDASGLTAVHYAVIRSQLSCLLLLLQHGLDPKTVDKRMYTAADHGKFINLTPVRRIFTYSFN